MADVKMPQLGESVTERERRQVAEKHRRQKYLSTSLSLR